VFCIQYERMRQRCCYSLISKVLRNLQCYKIGYVSPFTVQLPLNERTRVVHNLLQRPDLNRSSGSRVNEMVLRDFQDDRVVSGL
jgi:hypothetical protein